MNVDMAKRLADRRRNAGLTQEALAEKLEVSRQAVSKWERSESSPDTDNLIALADLYGVSLDELLYGDVADAEDASADSQDAGAHATESSRNASAHENGSEVEQRNSAAAADNARRESGDERTEDHGSSAAAEGPQAHDDGKAHPEDDESPFPPHGTRNDRRRRGRHYVDHHGIHIDDGDDHVHINWRDGVNVLDREGNSVHVGWDGVHVNGTDYRSLDEANAAMDGMPHPGWTRSPFRQAWDRFPFPAFVLLAYLLAGIFLGQWLMGLFLFFAIPLYYLVGGLIDSKRLGAFRAGLYPWAVVAAFCYLAFVEGMAHPAWVLFLTIPLVECILHALSKWWRGRKHENGI
ncbi:helix-turn-helix domain-containing protein [Adlercreutzia aquisgranensis]|uniref:helix-turn-helix domain-containing protein n=1 Tax=Adlercreutzia aquisgranensis TaxID=2941323 RepID=UPI00203D3905|nr:helix-turn-helix domain-containing protein [Adlercreutzia aquisgranensis]